MKHYLLFQAHLNWIKEFRYLTLLRFEILAKAHTVLIAIQILVLMLFYRLVISFSFELKFVKQQVDSPVVKRLRASRNNVSINSPLGKLNSVIRGKALKRPWAWQTNSQIN